MERRRRVVVFIFVLFAPGCRQLYPLDELSSPPSVSKVGETVHIRMPKAVGQYIRKVKNDPDRIIVTLERCEKCKESGRIEIPNPDDLPIYVADETVTKQVYPVNEFDDEHSLTARSASVPSIEERPSAATR